MPVLTWWQYSTEKQRKEPREIELGSLLLDFISFMNHIHLSYAFCIAQAKVSNGYGKAISCTQSSDPCLNRFWVWNMPLLRHKEPTHLVLSLLPCVGMLNECSFILLKCVSISHRHTPNSQYFTLQGAGLGSYCGTRGLYIGCLGEPLAMGDWLPWLKLIVLSVFSTHIKHCSIQFLCLRCVSLGNSDVKMWWAEGLGSPAGISSVLLDSYM